MQPYGLTLNTPPATEPLTTAEAKAHLRIDHSDEDALIDSLIKGAREFVEGRTGRQLVTATWDVTFDRFPCGRAQIKLPKWPTQSVESISYLDTAGVSQTWPALSYRVATSSEPAIVMPAVDTSYPATIREPAAVTVRAVAGYGDAAAVPEAAKQAMLLLIAHWHENREAGAADLNQDVMLSVESWLRVLDPGEWF